MTSVDTDYRSSTLWRGYYLLRHHRPAQLVSRMLKTVHRKIGLGTLVAKRVLRGSSPCDVRLHSVLGAIANHRARCREIFSTSDHFELGQFDFQNAHVNMGFPPQWSADGSSNLLWQFQLHYHEFLLPSLVASESLSVAWKVVNDWIINYPLRNDNLQVGWHPFCISRRLPVWYLLWNREPPPADLRHDVSRSLVCQAKLLEICLENDLGGNHLLENVRGLVFSACMLHHPESAKWRKKAFRILEAELKHQILSHGEHFERSTMYHMHVLDLLADIRDLAIAFELKEFHAVCEAYLPRMCEFARKILHPLGTLPQFADGERMCARAVSTIIERAARTGDSSNAGASVVEAGQYWAARADDGALIYDANPALADDLPGHAHCDLLTFELSISGNPVIVDAGTFDYAESEMRDYCRSTAAHNVLQVDGVEQFDFWSNFRIGYRGTTSGMKTGVTEADDMRIDWAESSHDAYRRLGVPKTCRRMGVIGNHTWICVDWITELQSSRLRTLVSRLNFHPDIELNGDSAWKFTIGEIDYSIYALGADVQIQAAAGWHCPSMGVRVPSRVLEVEHHGTHRCLGWAISRNLKLGQLSLRSLDRGFELCFDKRSIWTVPDA